MKTPIQVLPLVAESGVAVWQEEASMLKLLLTHVYVIVMAFIIMTAANIVAAQYGEKISSAIHSLVGGTDQQIEQMHDKVKNWNKDIVN